MKAITGECPFEVIGQVGGGNLNITVNGETAVSAAIADLETAWSDSLESRLES